MIKFYLKNYIVSKYSIKQSKHIQQIKVSLTSENTFKTTYQYLPLFYMLLFGNLPVFKKTNKLRSVDHKQTLINYQIKISNIIDFFKKLQYIVLPNLENKQLITLKNKKSISLKIKNILNYKETDLLATKNKEYILKKFNLIIQLIFTNSKNNNFVLSFLQAPIKK